MVQNGPGKQQQQKKMSNTTTRRLGALPYKVQIPDDPPSIIRNPIRQIRLMYNPAALDTSITSQNISQALINAVGDIDGKFILKSAYFYGHDEVDAKSYINVIESNSQLGFQDVGTIGSGRAKLGIEYPVRMQNIQVINATSSPIMFFSLQPAGAVEEVYFTLDYWSS